MTAIIIDDDYTACQVLTNLLAEVAPEVIVIDKVNSVSDGVKAIRKHSPSIVFCDIEMPVLSGLQLLDFFNPEEITFSLIFATSYSEYAVRAFQLSAIDYLLKPIDKNLLKAAVEKAEKMQTVDRTQLYQNFKQNIATPNFTKIALTVSNGVVFVETKDILYLKADNVYTEVFLADKSRIVVSKPIKDFEKMLDTQPFFRTHRTFLVNLLGIKSYSKSDGGFITMENNDVVALARERKIAFQQSWAAIKI